MPCWVTFSCQDSTHLNSGDSLEACARMIEDADPILQDKDGYHQHHQVLALGINCTPPQYIEDAIYRLRKVLSPDRLVIVYPNSGEVWEQRTWKEGSGVANPEDFADLAEKWVCAGANIIGGCCRTSFDTIAAIRRRLVPWWLFCKEGKDRGWKIVTSDWGRNVNIIWCKSEIKKLCKSSFILNCLSHIYFSKNSLLLFHWKNEDGNAVEAPRSAVLILSRSGAFVQLPFRSAVSLGAIHVVFAVKPWNCRLHCQQWRKNRFSPPSLRLSPQHSLSLSSIYQFRACSD